MKVEITETERRILLRVVRDAIAASRSAMSLEFEALHANLRDER